jgi:hypothetical protein
VAAPAGEDNEQADWMQRDFGLAAPIAIYEHAADCWLGARSVWELGIWPVPDCRERKQIVQFFLKKYCC